MLRFRLSVNGANASGRLGLRACAIIHARASLPPKPPTYDAGFRDRVLALLEQTPPPGLAHWDGREVAGELGASVHAMWRLLRGKEYISNALELGVSVPIRSLPLKPLR